CVFFFFSSRRRHTRSYGDWSSDVCSSDLSAVLNADDPLVAEMRKHCSGSVIFFSMQEKNELVERYVRRGGKAVVLQPSPRGEMMVLREGRRTMPIAWVHQLPATFEGRARMMVANAMAAAAAAHAAA